MEHLGQHFHRYFDLIPATTADICDRVFQLRYQVYCEELGFEDASAFPDGREKDGVDPHALHCLLVHKPTGLSAGCFRLILCPDAEYRLPFEIACGEHLDHSEWHPRELAYDQFGEISRLAVHQHFRRRNGEHHTPIGVTNGGLHDDAPRQYPLVATGLFLGSTALAIHLGLERVYVMMEPRLGRLLRSCGIVFKQVGEVINYHGQRGPFMITRDLIYQHLPPDARRLMEEFQQLFQQHGIKKP